jgi:nucleoid DNA-binding protein
MRQVYQFAVVAVAGMGMLCGTASAMNKAELVDAIANGSKLTKADSGRALDAFVNATGKALKKGDRLSLVGFGSFSVSKRVASPGGCASDVEVDFSASSSFTAKKEEGGRHTPFQNKFARIVPQSDGSIWVLGPNNGEAVQQGDEVLISPRPGQSSGTVQGVILGVIVRSSNESGGYEVIANAFGYTIAGVVLGGVERSDLKIGGSLETLPPVVEDEPVGECLDGEYDGYIATDADILKEMQAETRLPQSSVLAAYNTLLSTIIDEVNAGEQVDIGGFGMFVEDIEISASVADDPCAGLPENCPPTGTASATVYPYIDVNVSLESGAATQAEIRNLEAAVESIAKRAARTGRNPQTGKEIKIAAKKVAKFKAGADLAKTVNK